MPCSLVTEDPADGLCDKCQALYDERLERQLEVATRADLECALRYIVLSLFDNLDPYTEWDAERVEFVAQALSDAGLNPCDWRDADAEEGRTCAGS